MKLETHVLLIRVGLALTAIALIIQSVSIYSLEKRVHDSVSKSVPDPVATSTNSDGFYWFTGNEETKFHTEKEFKDWCILKKYGSVFGHGSDLEGHYTLECAN